MSNSSRPRPERDYDNYHPPRDNGYGPRGSTRPQPLPGPPRSRFTDHDPPSSHYNKPHHRDYPSHHVQPEAAPRERYGAGRDGAYDERERYSNSRGPPPASARDRAPPSSYARPDNYRDRSEPYEKRNSRRDYPSGLPSDRYEDERRRGGPRDEARAPSGPSRGLPLPQQGERYRGMHAPYESSRGPGGYGDNASGRRRDEREYRDRRPYDPPSPHG